MALTVVNVTDTINTFRLKTNELSANVGDKGNFLTGIATANVVEAINSVFKNANSAVHLIGNLSLLDAGIINRNNLVSAINYVWANIDDVVYVTSANGVGTNLYVTNAYIQGGTFNNANIFGGLVVSNAVFTNAVFTNNITSVDNIVYFYSASDGTYIAAEPGGFRFANKQANLAYITHDGNPTNQNTLLTFRFANLHLAQNTDARMSNAYIANANLYYANIDHANVNDLIVTDNVITFGKTNGANITWNPVANAILFNNGGYSYGMLQANNQLLDQNTVMKVGLANIHYLQVNNTSVSNITILGANVRNMIANDNSYYFHSTTEGSYIRWEELPGAGYDGHYVFAAKNNEYTDITYTGFPFDENSLVSTKFGNINYVTTVGNQNQYINGVKVFTDTLVLEAWPGIWWDPASSGTYPLGLMGNTITSGHNNMYFSVQKTSVPTAYFTYTYQAQDGTFAAEGNLYSGAGKVTLNDGTKVRELKANVIGLYLDGANIVDQITGNINYVTTTRDQTVSGIKHLTGISRFSNYQAFWGRGAGNAIYWTDQGSNFSPVIYSEDLNNLTIDANSSSASSNLTLASKVVYAPYIMFGAQQLVKTVVVSPGSTTINLALGGIFECTMNSSITSLSITNIPGNTGLTQTTASIFILRLIYTGAAVYVTWPASFKWPGGTAPALSSGSSKVDTFAFYTTNYGSTWNAFIVGQNN